MFDGIDGEVGRILDEEFQEQSTGDVPDVSDKRLTHGATGLSGEFTYLYVDMRGSSDLSDHHRRQTVARIFKAFHHSMATLVQAHGGHIRSFDGDRVMAIFAGEDKEARATRCAFAMLGCVEVILRPRIEQRYRKQHFDVGIGISTSDALVIKAGIGRNQNNRDLVSVGHAANEAAKFSDVAKRPQRLYVCELTHSRLPRELTHIEHWLVDTKMWTGSIPILEDAHFSSTYYWDPDEKAFEECEGE